MDEWKELGWSLNVKYDVAILLSMLRDTQERAGWTEAPS